MVSVRRRAHARSPRRHSHRETAQRATYRDEDVREEGYRQGARQVHTDSSGGVRIRSGQYSPTHNDLQSGRLVSGVCARVHTSDICRKPNKTENSEWTGEGEPPANVMAKPSRFFMTVESVGSLKAHNIVIHGEQGGKPVAGQMRCTGIAQLLAKLRNLQHAVQMEMQEQAMTINA